MKNVLNLDELQLEDFSKGENYASRCARIGPLVGARQLGYSYDIVPPGKRACPFHSHRAQEEMFFIVSGSGTLRYGAETRPIRAGDVIDSDSELAFLSISTTTDPEICEYPDSGKVIAYDGKWRHSTEAASGGVDYWKGEV